MEPMQHETPSYTFDRARFSKMLDRVVTDKEFSARLGRSPVATLRESGFELRDDIARQIGDKTLVEIQQFDPLGPVANVAVSVGVDVVISVGISVAVHTKAQEDPREAVINPVLRDRVINEVEARVQIAQTLDRLTSR